MIELPYKDSTEYIQRVGAGIFQGVFDTAVYIMDCHEVKHICTHNIYIYT